MIARFGDCGRPSPVAFRRPLRKYLVTSVESLSSVGLGAGVSSFDPRLYYITRKSRGAAGAVATHIDDILCCGVSDLLLKARRFREERFGKLNAREQSVAHVGMFLAQGKDSL